MKWPPGDLYTLRLSPQESWAFIRVVPFRTRLLDQLAEASDHFEPEEMRRYASQAERSRELAWSYRPGDEIWITVEARDHPELSRGVSCVVVASGGQVIFRDVLAAS